MRDIVKPKKSFGQHFLKDKNIAAKIVGCLTGFSSYTTIVEIGPGMGVLSDIIISSGKWNWYGVELDKESVLYLQNKYPHLSTKIIQADFLRVNLENDFPGNNIGIIGNFPYNISSQIIFKVIENRTKIPELVGMFQKEVALRICSKPGSKVYGILSVLCQAFYNTEYLFQVNENVFIPPPKVKSAVIRLKRNDLEELPCDENLFFSIVKAAFNQRRKTLRNSLKAFNVNWDILIADLHTKRPEQLSVDCFFDITNAVSKSA